MFCGRASTIVFMFVWGQWWHEYFWYHITLHVHGWLAGVGRYFFWATMIGAALQVWSSAGMAATTLGCNSGLGEYCWQHGKIDRYVCIHAYMDTYTFFVFTLRFIYRDIYIYIYIRAHCWHFDVRSVMFWDVRKQTLRVKSWHWLLSARHSISVTVGLGLVAQEQFAPTHMSFHVTLWSYLWMLRFAGWFAPLWWCRLGPLFANIAVAENNHAMDLYVLGGASRVCSHDVQSLQWWCGAWDYDQHGILQHHQGPPWSAFTADVLAWLRKVWNGVWVAYDFFWLLMLPGFLFVAVYSILEV